jgi:outer membrane biosynthesis protein TonB
MKSKDTLYKEEENKRIGMIISFIVHTLIFMIFLLPLLQVPEVINSAGILIAFGEPDAGAKDEIKPADVTTKSSPASSPSASKPSQATEIDSKTREGEAPVKAKEKTTAKPAPVPTVPTKKNDIKLANDAKAKAESERKTKEAADKTRLEKEAAEKAEQANQKKKFSDLLGKGKGNNDNNNNQGNEKGDPDGKALDGISKGSGKVGGGLAGRGIEFEPKFSDNSQKTGKVSLNICVNSEGTVSKAEFTQKGSTTSDAYLIDLARKTAMKYKFSKSDIDSQCGTVTVDFKVQ